MEKPQDIDRAQDLTRRLVAARRDQLPERQRLDDVERLAVAAYGLREMGVPVALVHRQMRKGNGKAYATYAMEVAGMVVNMEGLEGWGDIARDLLDIKPGQAYTMDACQDPEKFLLLHMSPSTRRVFASEVAAEHAFLQAMVLQEQSPRAPNDTKAVRL